MQRAWILVGLAIGCGGGSTGTREPLAVSWSLGAGTSAVECAAIGSPAVRVTATGADGGEVVETAPCTAGTIRVELPRGAYRVRAELLGATTPVAGQTHTAQVATDPVEVRFAFTLEHEQHTVRDGLCGPSGICDLPASCEVFLAELPGV